MVRGVDSGWIWGVAKNLKIDPMRPISGRHTGVRENAGKLKLVNKHHG